MSGNVDVGDAIELTFSTAPGSTVTATWLDPNGTPIFADVPVPESPPGSGNYPYTFLPLTAGWWQALFVGSGEAQEQDVFWIRATVQTGLPPLASVAEVEAQYGTMTAAQQGLANTLLRIASKMVRQQIPLIDAYMAAGKVDPEVAGAAIVNMVLRVLRNPRGLRGSTTGPFSVTYDTTVAAGLLVVGKDELAMLMPAGLASGTTSGAIGTMWTRPGMAPRRHGRVYPAQGGGYGYSGPAAPGVDPYYNPAYGDGGGYGPGDIAPDAERFCGG